MNAHHLVVGAGPVGQATANLLADAGHAVTLLSRSGTESDHPQVQAVAADASQAMGLARMARGASVIYNCLNPAYHRWATDWPPLAQSVLAAAQDTGAVLATVGNLYGYGPVNTPMTPDLPLAGMGVKAQVRNQMWQEAAAAHAAGRVRMTEVRGSDYIGVGAQSHLGDQVVPRILAGQRPQVVVPVDQPHSFTYVPDVAATLVAAAAAAERSSGPARVWHVPSAAPRTLQQAIIDIYQIIGAKPRRLVELGPRVQSLLGVFVPVMRELREVRYQFERPYVIDATATTAELGIVATDWEQALRAIVDGYRG